MGGAILITGGSRGIGAATARLAARRGHPVCLTYRSDEQSADAVVTHCRGLGVDAIAVRADVAVEDDVVRAFDEAAALGPLAGLVNNAGIVDRQSRVEDMSAERLRALLDINVVGAFVAAREAVRRMSSAHGGAGGSIVNVSSRAAVLGSAGEYVDYAASKAAVDTLTIGLSREVATEGIRVNAVRPGLIDTEIHASAGEPGRVARLQSTVPMGRGGQPDEVAEAIVWLLSSAASYVTGTFIDVSGGR
jgi:NAD(P)-dependent dehydrogenase (short-subunit alcohol dehydrogenase family)